MFGLAASLVPGALTVDSFHTLRMIAYPVFLLVLTVPALDWLVGEGIGDAADRPASPLISATVRLSAATAILGLTAAQAAFFFFQYHRFTADRAEYLDAAYKPLYDEAVAMRARPIYLVDGYWGPAYIHAFWYATVENRGLTEFVHLPYGEHAPPGSLVLSSEYDCSDCDVIRSEGGFILYVQNGQPVQGTDGEAVTR